MKNAPPDHPDGPAKHGLTSTDMEAIRNRHFEICRDRQTYADLNLLRAVKLGQMLKQSGA